MPFASVAIALACPNCSLATDPVVGMRWGYCDSIRLNRVDPYSMGSPLAWASPLSTGEVPTWSSFSAFDANIGDPALSRVLVRANEVPARCLDCGHPSDGLGIEVSDDLISGVLPLVMPDFEPDVDYYVWESGSWRSAWHLHDRALSYWRRVGHPVSRRFEPEPNDVL